MHQMKRMSATVVMGIALAAAPGWVDAADDKKPVKETVKESTQAVKEKVTDSWITAKTKIALFADSRVSGTQVNVETTKGSVALRGKVDNEAAKAAATEVARGIEGVQNVKNDLQVVPPSEKKMVEAKDDEITKHVKERLARDARLKRLDVRTDNGVVTLQGKVPSIMDSARASQTAREVPGVRAVKNDVTYDTRSSSVFDRDSSRLTSTRENRMQDDRVMRAEAHVRATQEALKERGYDPGPIDGMWGPRTAAAVKDFQHKENLTVTGRIDAETLGKLDVGVGGATRKTQSP